MKLRVSVDSLRLIEGISRFLTAEDGRAYLVGGFVRDGLLGRPTADIDIAVAGDALRIAEGVSAALGGKYIPLDTENGVGRVIINRAGGNFGLDFTTLQGNIGQDLARRDFTIDAIAIELQDFLKQPAANDVNNAGIDLDAACLIDPFHGREDLHAGIIRAVSTTALQDDPARLLRAVRLAAELGFSIESETEALIRRDSRLIAGVAGERIREELLRLLALPGAGSRLAYLDELGLLTALFPELASARGVSQPTVHVWDVLEHSLKTVAAAEFLLGEGTWVPDGGVLAAVPWSEELSEYFRQEVAGGSTRKSLLKLAALLHDIAKPQTKTVDSDGRARFLGHPQAGAETAAAIMERLRFSTREIRLVEMLVKHHLRPTQMSQEGFPSPRAIYRYFRDTDEAGIDILFLSLADHLATRGETLDMAEWQRHTGIVARVLASHSEEPGITRPPRLIDGHDLMETFHLSPGPEIGELLETVREAQAAGEVNSRQEALDYVKNLMTSREPGSRSESS